MSAIARGYFYLLTGRVVREPARMEVSRPYSRLEAPQLGKDLPWMSELLQHGELTAFAAVLSVKCAGVWDDEQAVRAHAFSLILWDSYCFFSLVIEPHTIRSPGLRLAGV